MKNRLIKGAHLSEKKCKEIVQLFCEDLTATQIANISGVSRVTVNNYLKLIRTHIAKFLEEQNPANQEKGYFLYIPYDNRPVKNGQELNEEQVLRIYYGFYKKDGRIYTDWLEDLSKATLQQFFKAKASGADTAAMPAIYQRYHAIADFGDWKLFRFDNRETGSRHVLDDVSSFWSHTKNRLLKFRGLNKNTLYLHVKESEFRYNYRNEDMYGLLLGIIHKLPLHFSKQ